MVLILTPLFVSKLRMLYFHLPYCYVSVLDEVTDSFQYFMRYRTRFSAFSMCVSVDYTEGSGGLFHFSLSDSAGYERNTCIMMGVSVDHTKGPCGLFRFSLCDPPGDEENIILCMKRKKEDVYNIIILYIFPMWWLRLYI